MRIGDQCVVEISYSLHLGDGEIVDSSTDEEPLVYLHGADQIVPGLERALAGMEAGESKRVAVGPEEGYGECDPEAIQEVPRSAFGDKPVAVGDSFIAVDEDQNEVPVRIEAVGEETVRVDFNHPLAGKTLHFSVTIKDVRQATPEELEHGHAHQAGQIH
jgi:FKBP-type peptidyl-prolyl cis-trans isomerase SlyD